MTRAATTIVFTTRNRLALLAEGLRAARAQTVPARLIVVDDASDDGTTEMLRAEFPEGAFTEWFPRADRSAQASERFIERSASA